MYKLYGIKNCDTVKKARRWLDDHRIEFQFHDYRANGLDSALLADFESELGWENMLNRRGTTWRQLGSSDKTDLDKTKALNLMLTHPALIKRPILEADGKLLIGFSPEQYRSEL
ncbi:MAG: ArsC family reductase [Gammaproteobacteria bacterium]